MSDSLPTATTSISSLGARGAIAGAVPATGPATGPQGAPHAPRTSGGAQALPVEAPFREQPRIAAEPESAPLGRLAQIAAAGASRDLARVLGVLDTNLGVLELEWLSADGARAVARLRAAASYLRGLSRELRVATVRPAGRGTHRRIQLSAWWPNVDVLLRAVHGDGLAVRADVPEDLPDVRIKPHQLTQVVFKLVGNASRAIASRALADGSAGAKALRRGEVDISARLAGGGKSVHLTVADNGAGMSEEAQARAFEPFSPGLAALDGPQVGFALVQRLVESAGGCVRLTSALGAGTTVTIELPADTGGCSGTERPRRKV
jgi:signal transduction histidine kinase